MSDDISNNDEPTTETDSSTFDIEAELRAEYNIPDFLKIRGETAEELAKDALEVRAILDKYGASMSPHNGRSGVPIAPAGVAALREGRRRGGLNPEAADEAESDWTARAVQWRHAGRTGGGNVHQPYAGF